MCHILRILIDELLASSKRNTCMLMFGSVKIDVGSNRPMADRIR